MNFADVARYFRNPSVSRWKKLLGVLAVAYVALPFDAIPDVIPIVGWLDDVGVLAAAVFYFRREVAKHSKSSTF